MAERLRGLGLWHDMKRECCGMGKDGRDPRDIFRPCLRGDRVLGVQESPMCFDLYGAGARRKLLRTPSPLKLRRRGGHHVRRRGGRGARQPFLVDLAKGFRFPGSAEGVGSAGEPCEAARIPRASLLGRLAHHQMHLPAIFRCVQCVHGGDRGGGSNNFLEMAWHPRSFRSS
eukprot:scaffold731_cov261-Pinguiococcus_pyrenoidosus.AAC.106